MGRKTSETLPDGRRSYYAYYPSGELREVSGAGTYPVSYEYDASGRMSALTTYKNYGAKASATTRWDYGSAGRLEGKAYADGTRTSYAYTPGGRLSLKTQARGASASYSYDNAGELSGVAYSDGTPGVAYAKDLQGRIVGVVDGAGAWSLSYEDDGSLKELEMPYAAGYAIANSYDALGRRGSLALKQNGATLESQSFNYDAMSRLAAASNGAMQLAAKSGDCNLAKKSEIARSWACVLIRNERTRTLFKFKDRIFDVRDGFRYCHIECFRRIFLTTWDKQGEQWRQPCFAENKLTTILYGLFRCKRACNCYFNILPACWFQYWDGDLSFNRTGLFRRA